MGADAFIFGEVFDHRYYDFELPVVPQTILDLGANVGYTAIFFDRKFTNAEIACVEPMPQNVAVLRQNLALNDVAATVIDAAVTVTDSIVQMETHARDYGHKIAVDPMEVTTDLVSCKGISVPSIMKQMGWNRISLLKVDIEGYERFLLKENCSWLGLVDAICIECHPGYDEADLKRLAQDYGFQGPTRLPGTWLLIARKTAELNAVEIARP